MKELPKFLPAKVGRFRSPGQRWIRITAETCVDDLDMKMLRDAQAQHGYVVHVPSQRKRTAEFTKLLLGGRKYVFAERVTGTLYDPQGVSSSPDLVAEFV